MENKGETLNILLRVIEEFPEFKWVESSYDYQEGMNTILKHAPDVVFVNVDAVVKEFPDVYSYCKEINEYLERKPLYIAISNDKEKAYQAIKNKFFDYLLKPGTELDVRKMILQVLKQRKFQLNDVICLKSYKDFTLLNVHDILYLQADNNSTDFFLVGNNKTSAYKTLKFFETSLPKNFLRIHHSYIVNREHISRVNFGKCKCYLNNNKIAIPVSKSYRHNLQPLKKLLAENTIALQ